MKRILKENGLSIVLLTLFFLCLCLGQSLSGHAEYNEDRSEHRLAPISLRDYAFSAHFLEATMENWESEFLQMVVYVVLTALLFQKGSSESKRIGEAEPVDRDPRLSRHKQSAPWPVRRGGWVLRIYENSLSLAFALLFLFSFVLHAVAGRSNYNEQQMMHGQPAVDLLGYVSTSRFWFESMQNWQSEFLAIACMVVFSIFLRQRGSPESKPVDTPHWETGVE